MKCNKLGFLAFVVAFGVAYGILWTLGTDEEGLWMMIAGPLLSAIDVGYRRVVGLRLLGDVDRGPAILWLPAWVWGVFWFGLGTFYHCQHT
ncbi:MAG TPA: hypothetical protein VHN14_32865 [Kofleriaceae bacterium]|jgi:hypothetical protein|nr:hypothetical protein [Kofleriaceae bacterium]